MKKQPDFMDELEARFSPEGRAYVERETQRRLREIRKQAKARKYNARMAKRIKPRHAKTIRAKKPSRPPMNWDGKVTNSPVGNRIKQAYETDAQFLARCSHDITHRQAKMRGKWLIRHPAGGTAGEYHSSEAQYKKAVRNAK